MLAEPLTVVREYECQWVRPEVDLAELAKLRFIEGWPIQRLARHFRLGTTSVYQHLSRARKVGPWAASEN